MKDYSINLVKSQLRETNLYQLDAKWVVHQDDCGRNCQKLISDIGDEIGIVWVTKKGAWYTETSGPYIDESLVKQSIIETFICNLEQKLEKLNFLLKSTELNFFMRHQNNYPHFSSLEKTIIERAISHSIKNQLYGFFSNCSSGNRNHICSLKFDFCCINIIPATLQHAFREGACYPASGPISIKVEIKHLNKIVLDQVYLPSLEDQAFKVLLRKIKGVAIREEKYIKENEICDEFGQRIREAV